MVRTDIHEVAEPVATAVLVHGLGEGAWFWDPWLPLFAARQLRTVVVTLPGHGDDADPSLVEAAEAVGAAVDSVEGRRVLVGHSLGGLVSQMAAQDRTLDALVLLAPVPGGQVRVVPGRRELLSVLRLAPSLARGRPITVPWDDYRSGGLADMEEAIAREVYARITPWPNRLVRDTIRRPVIDAHKITCPVLVAMGRLDRIVPWQQARILADLYEGIAWRYDGLGHMAPWEPGGERMGRDLVGFCVSPSRPEVIESEAFMPSEGVGYEVRRARRGEAMKKRSAYGQKKSAR